MHFALENLIRRTFFKNARFERYSDLSNRKLRLLTGFLTRHCRNRNGVIRMGLTDTEECTFFGEEETPIHLATECPSLHNQRK